MGNHAAKRELSAEKGNKDSEGYRGESEKKKSLRDLSQEASEDSDVFGEADVEQNNGTPLQDTAVTDSKCTANPKNAWPDANPADPGGRPHLIRLFSRDAPGREDNTFKDRPSESDELQTIQEDSAAAPEGLDVMASQKRPSQRHGSKYLASASTMDHARHGFLPRHRDTGILDSLGRFFGADRGAPKRGSGKAACRKPGLQVVHQDGHHAARTTHYGSLPQKAQHGRPQDENPVVHFFKNIVTPRTPPPSQGKGRGLSLSRFSWGAEGQKPGFGYGGRAPDYKPAHKGLKGAQDAQGTLSKIFKLVMYLPDGGGSRAASSLSTSCFLAGPPPSCSEQAFLQALPEQSLCQVTGPGPLRELEDKGATAGPWQGQDQEASLSREPAGAKVT
uniref:Myelin basic protein n=1 Tax=Sus scrofa TaxID=9823 RepID=A0A8D1JBH1_PIG